VAAASSLLILWPVRSIRSQEAPSPDSPPTIAETEEENGSMDPMKAKKELEKKFLEAVEPFGWKREGQGVMGQWAEIAVPRGYRFTGGDGARKLLRAYGNLVGTSEQGVIAPENLDWFILFSFRDDGYVKDDEKDKLDADAMLKAMQEGDKGSNQQRKAAGLPALHTEGWVVKPHYDERTHNLEWGLLLRGDDSGAQSVNYKIKLLGRSGVMDATLVCEPSTLETVLPKARTLMAGFQFQTGQTYAEYKKGDKIAQYGLTALVLGGGAALAAKSGLLAVIAKFFGKFFKIIIAVLIAGAFVVKKFFGGLFGRGRDSHQHDSLPPPPPP
jgi:uncharacterized membrane-anchored protein